MLSRTGQKIYSLWERIGRHGVWSTQWALLAAKSIVGYLATEDDTGAALDAALVHGARHHCFGQCIQETDLQASVVDGNRAQTITRQTITGRVYQCVRNRVHVNAVGNGAARVQRLRHGRKALVVARGQKQALLPVRLSRPSQKRWPAGYICQHIKQPR